MATDQTTEAEELLRQVLQVQEETLNPGHPQLLDSLYVLGKIHLSKGDTNKAVAVFSNVSKRYQQVFGDSHPHTLGATGKMASALRMVADFAQAQKLLSEKVALETERYSPNDPRVLSTRYTLAGLLKEREHFDEAIEILEDMHTAEIDDHRLQFLIQYQLVECYHSKSNFQTAESHAQELIKLSAEHFGKFSHRYEKAFSSLVALLSRRKGTEALALREAQLARLRVNFGVENSRTIRCMSRLAGAYRRLQRHADSTELARKADDLARHCTGLVPTERINVRLELGKSLCWARRYDEGVAILSGLLEQQEVQDHPKYVCVVLHELGIQSELRGDSVAAERFFRREIESRLRAYEPIHSTCLEAMSKWYRLANDLDDVPPGVDELKSKGTSTFELVARYVDVTGRIGSLISFLAEQGRHNEIDSIQRRRIEYSETLSAEDLKQRPGKAGQLRAVVTAYMKTENWERAMAHGEVAYEILQHKLGDSQPTLKLGKDLAQCYEYNGEWEQAINLHQVNRRIRKKLTGKQAFYSECRIARALWAWKRSPESLKLLKAINTRWELAEPNHPLRYRGHKYIGEIHIAEQQWELAKRTLKESLEIAEKTKNPTGSKDVRELLDKVHRETEATPK